MVRSKGMKVLAATAVLSAALGFMSPAAVLSPLAATGSVNGTDVNVRGEASTTSSVVGTVSSGETFQVGDSTTDSDGNTWYQVTLGSGATGYIRSDLMTVNQDDAGTATSSQDDAQQQDGESANAGSTEAAETPSQDSSAAATSDTGGYQIVLAPDDTGEKTYYLYNNNANERMKISDIESLKDRVTTAEAAAKAASTKWKAFVIAFAVLALAAIGGCVVLFLKLRDALNNSARERNLARERSMARKRGADADDLSAVGRERRPVRDRNDAYPSRRQADAARRPLQQGRRAPLPGDEDIRTDRPERDMRDMRGFQAKPGMNRAIGDGVRESARRPEDRDIRTDRPAPRMQRDQRVSRPMGAEEAREMRGMNPQQRPDAVRRPQRPAGAAGADPRQRMNDAPQQAPQRPSRPVKNFAADDDFDYDFINMDDDNQ